VVSVGVGGMRWRPRRHLATSAPVPIHDTEVAKPLRDPPSPGSAGTTDAEELAIAALLRQVRCGRVARWSTVCVCVYVCLVCD
jgi:hypothetical protein